jgi:Collagen triple helix repeat (20 copies)
MSVLLKFDPPGITMDDVSVNDQGDIYKSDMHLGYIINPCASRPGPAGPTGPCTSHGATGHQGPRGCQGYVGLHGSTIGATGPIGPDGFTGLKGAIGKIGDHGWTGLQGPTGLPGREGVCGYPCQYLYARAVSNVNTWSHVLVSSSSSEYPYLSEKYGVIVLDSNTTYHIESAIECCVTDTKFEFKLVMNGKCLVSSESRLHMVHTTGDLPESMQIVIEPQHIMADAFVVITEIF